MLRSPINKVRSSHVGCNCRKVRRGRQVDVRKPKTFMKAGYIPEHQTALIIHGFNGTQTSQHIMYLKDGDLLHFRKPSLTVLRLICLYSLSVAPFQRHCRLVPKTFSVRKLIKPCFVKIRLSLGTRKKKRQRLRERK